MRRDEIMSLVGEGHYKMDATNVGTSADTSPDGTVTIEGERGRQGSLHSTFTFTIRIEGTDRTTSV